MPNSADLDLQTSITLLQSELTRLRDSSVEAWRNYLTWFTWFFTIQVAVMSWVITKDSRSVNNIDIDVMAATFITLNLLGVIAALRQRAFCVLQRKRAAHICRLLSARAESGGLSVEITSGFSSDLVRSTLQIFVVVLLIGVVVWCYIHSR